MIVIIEITFFFEGISRLVLHMTLFFLNFFSFFFKGLINILHTHNDSLTVICFDFSPHRKCVMD